MTIALPERKILLPRLEFPRWLRFPRGVSDERVARMIAPLGGMLTPLGVTLATPNVLASVPWVAQWKFNNNGNDSIGANHLTNKNGATFTTGLLGGATGATQLVRTSNQYWSVSPSFNLAGVDWTICGWIKPTTLVNYEMIVTKWTSNYSNAEFAVLSYGDGRIEFGVYGPNNGNYDRIITGAGAIITGAWQMIAVWWNSVTQTAYLQINNGTILSKVTTITISNSNAPIMFGNDTTGNYFYNGVLDNWCIAKSAAGGGGVLTAAQRTAFYNGGSGTEQLT